ncbi:DUF1566 domain-containing protein [bacterium]|nr:DUF1566 domain-containing protein [bacterium]
MKRCGSIFALFLMFFAVSACDNGLKFNNPNDKNSDAYQGGDADSEGTDDDAERPAGREQGGLYGECYPDNTCNEGLECDVLNNICKKDTGDSGDTTPDGDSGDSGDTTPDGDSGDSGDTTPDGDSGDSGDTTPDGDSGDSGDTTPSDTGDTDPTDTGDTTPTEEEICVEAGGTYDYFAEDELTKCYKIVECSPKPANTEWRGEQSYTEYYDLDEGYWTHFGLNYSTEYGDTGEAKVCQYICAPGFDWNGYACTAPSTPDNLTLGNICTGQTKCFNNEAEITCPTSSSANFFGQDAQYTSECTAQSFTVQTISSQKVVLDNNTGLMWQQTAPSTTYTWEEAKTYCSNLTYAGYSDWRLPSPVEFHTISDNGRYAPAFNTTYFPNITDSDSSRFWTSQERKADTTKAYYVRYYDAYSHIEAKTTSYNVMCVRGDALPEPVFTTQTISGEVVVNDSTTGLMWQKTYATGKTWQQALKYCEDLSYAGYTDWRLPNKNEAASLLNYNKSAAPYSDFPDMPSAWFWSSSTNVRDTDYAWHVDFFPFFYGHVDDNGKTNTGYVRCVR